MNWRALESLLARLTAAAGLLLFAPILVACALAIWLETGSPVLFRQVRVGRNGRSFVLYKFRSMKTGRGRSITAAGDPRITRVGRILRRYKLDELPQLFNVLLGDMAFIGPRPEVPRYVDMSDPLWQAVLSARPGISDLATLVYRNEEQLLAGVSDPESHYRHVILPDKLRLNLRYLTARNPLRDLKLLILTVRFSFWPSGFQSDRILRTF